jgi:hypothetical protein
MSRKPMLTLPSSVAEVVELTQRAEPPRPLSRIAAGRSIPGRSAGRHSRTRCKGHQ